MPQNRSPQPTAMPKPPDRSKQPQGRGAAPSRGPPHATPRTAPRGSKSAPPKAPHRPAPEVFAASDSRPAPSDMAEVIRKLRGEGDSNLIRRLRLAGIDPATGLKGADISGADLHGLVLQEYDLSGATLRWVDLADSRLSRANLAGAVLVQARLEAAHADGADFRGAQLRQANLRDADLAGADFTGADLSEASLFGANLAGVRADADLAAVAPLLAEPALMLEGLDPALELVRARRAAELEAGHARAVEVAIAAGREPPPPPPAVMTGVPTPLGLALLVDGMAHAVLQGALYGACGIDLAYYDPGAFPGLFVPWFKVTVEEIGMALEPRRRDYREARRRNRVAENVDAAARDDLHIGALAILARSFNEAEEHLEAGRQHLLLRRKTQLAATATALQALLALERLDHLNAVRRLKRALETADTIGDRLGIARYSLALLALAILHSEWQRAREFGDRLNAVLPADDPDRLGRLRDGVKGVLAWRLGDGSLARAAWREQAGRLASDGYGRDAALLGAMITTSARLDMLRGRG